MRDMRLEDGVDERRGMKEQITHTELWPARAKRVIDRSTKMHAGP